MWDKRFMGMAQLVASWSKDPSSKVGAVIVDNNRRIISTGFNGFPSGVKDEPVERDVRLMRTIHAEDNAILFAKCNVALMTLYVTHPPCARCAAKIIQSGIARVVYPPVEYKFAVRWHDDLRESGIMFKQAGVISCRLT